MTNSTCNQSGIYSKTFLQASPDQASVYASPPTTTANDYDNSRSTSCFGASNANDDESLDQSSMSQGLTVLQKLQQEGLFNFKSVPEKKRPANRSIGMGAKRPVIDDAYGKFTSTSSFMMGDQQP